MSPQADVEVVVRGAAATEAAGRHLAAGLRAGDLLALTGELGAGKTTLVRGIAEGLGVEPVAVHSPTYVLHHVYHTPGLTLHHLDLFRLGPSADVDVLGLDELVLDGVVVIEWADYAALEALDPVWIGIEVTSSESRLLRLRRGAPERIRLAFGAAAG